MSQTPFYPDLITSELGVNRDGTLFSSNFFDDMTWNRFFNNFPKKIGGYSFIPNGTSEIIRNLYLVDKEQTWEIYIGRPSSVAYFTIFANGTFSSLIDITPIGFTDPLSNNYYPHHANVDNVWSFGLWTDESTATTYLVAHVAPNAADINSQAFGPVYCMDVNTTGPLTAVTTPNQEFSGGIAFSDDYIFGLDNGGIIFYTDDLFTWSASDALVLGAQKILRGEPIYGGSSQSMLFWSSNNVGRIQFVGGPTIWDKQVITSKSSLLAPNAIARYEPFFFWPGAPGSKKFFQFNGAVTPIPNENNLLYFYNNINKNYLGKCHAWVNYTFDEIWYHYPRGTATECTDVVIQKVDRGTFFDARVARSASISSLNINPILADANTEFYRGNNIYGLWEHEKGVNKAIDGSEYAIPYSVTYSPKWLALAKGLLNNIYIDNMVPDAQFTGTLKVSLQLRDYPTTAPVTTINYNFIEGQGRINIHKEASIVSVTISNNELNGDCQLGNSILVSRLGSLRAGVS